MSANRALTMMLMLTVEWLSNATATVFSKNTAANCECARDRAHRRRYEAVFEIVPSTNSIVSIN
jgi:hypothetical protein